MSRLTTTVILAGGLATRLKSLTKKIPKSLIKINNKPFIIYQIENLKTQGIKNILICAGHMGEQIENIIGDGKSHGLNIIYSHEKKKLLGTGGAIKNALKYLDNNFFVLYGDSWLEIDYKIFYNNFLKSKYKYMLSIFKNNNKFDNSNINIRNDWIEEYHKSHDYKNFEYIDYGLSILSKEIFDEYPSDTNFDLSNLFSKLAAKKKLGYYEVFKRFYEIGSIEGLQETKNYLKGLP